MKIFLFLLSWTILLLGRGSTQKCSLSKADIVFVVDDSTSVQRIYFKLVLVFVQDVAGAQTIGPDATQIGFVSFSNTVKNQFFFTDNTDRDSLIAEIGNIRFRGGGTDIARALTEAYQSHFQDPLHGARDDAAKLLILITDGTSFGTEDISKTIRDAGIDILCVGITESVDLQQLTDIAGDSSKVFDAISFTSLADIKGRLITKTCDVIKPEVKPCDSSPCQNSGTCVDNGNGEFSCLCTKTYRGELCEIEVDNCASNPCLNGGTCVATFESFSCQCTEQFIGVICDIEIPIQPCQPNPCLNAGICLESGEDFSCRCQENFTGNTCETELSPPSCIPNPCQNKASCSESGWGPVCKCREGYGGVECLTGGVIPTVAVKGEDADFSCLNSQGTPRVVIDIIDIENQRQIRKADNTISLRKVEISDINGTLSCHYISSNANTSTSTLLPLIVVKKTEEPSETSTTFTCSIFTLLKNSNVDISVDYKHSEPNSSTPVVNLARGVSMDTESGALGPGYGVVQTKSIYSKAVRVQNGKVSVKCSVSYMDEEIWNGSLWKEQETQPKVKEPKGYPTWSWILLGVVVGGMLVCIIVFIICKKCRIKTTGVKKSQPEPAKESSAEELEELGKTSDHNSINGEEDNKNEESKIPLNDESQETISV